MRPGHLLFYLYSAGAVPGRFKSIFYQSLYQSPSRTGVLIALEMLASVPAIPFFGHLSDKLRSRTAVVHLCQAVSVIIFLMMLPVKLLGDRSPDISFIVLSGLATLFGFFYQPLFALVYTMSVDFLKKLNGDALKFAAERLWGCVGYAALTAILGLLLDYTSLDCYAVFICFVVCTFLFSGSIILFERDDRRQNGIYASRAKSTPLMAEEPEGSVKISLMDALKPVIFDGGIVNVLFYVLFFVQSAGMALVDNFLFLFLTTELGASHSLCGSTIVVSLLFEIPVFTFMPSVLKRVQLEHAMVFAAFVYSVRVIGYTVIPKPWMVLFLEPMHGIMFGTIDAASVAYVARRAAIGGEASAQSVLAAIRAAGFTIATVGGGFVIDYYGPRVLYWSSAVVVMSVATTFLLAHTITRWTRTKGMCEARVSLNL